MYENLQNIEEFYRFINVHDLAVVHIMRDNCTVCHAVLPQIQDLLKDYPKAQLGVINQSNVEEIAGELSIFTVPVDLIFLMGKKCIDKHVLSICNRLKNNCIWCKMPLIKIPG